MWLYYAWARYRERRILKRTGKSNTSLFPGPIQDGESCMMWKWRLGWWQVSKAEDYSFFAELHLTICCCSAPPLLTGFPPPRPAPTYSVPPCNFCSRHFCLRQHIFKWAGRTINRTKWFLKIKTASLVCLSLTLHGLSLTHTHTHTHSSNFRGALKADNLSDFDSVGGGVVHGESWTHYRHCSPCQARGSDARAGWGSLCIMAKKGLPSKQTSNWLKSATSVLPVMLESAALTQ